MKKRLPAILLMLCILLSLFPISAAAAAAQSDSMRAQDVQIISKTEYRITKDVTEYEWLLNNSTLSEQMVGHVMQINMQPGTTASLASGYSDYNIENIKNQKWAMVKTTEQAEAMETRRSENVVGAINGGGFDMSNGRPTGALVMNGTIIQNATGTTFWIDSDNQAHITDAAAYQAAASAGRVKEAISSFGDILRDGKALAGLDDYTRASRTAVGIKPNGDVVLFMVDGRQAPYSVGMTMAELAAAMEELGCQTAINLDGGGSSTFATQREGDIDNGTAAGLTLRCSPSDGYERKVSNSLMVISSAKGTGVFDHAAVTPNNAVYTPGSTIPFSAAGADESGAPAAVPADAAWEITEGASLGSIDSTTGVFTANTGMEGAVTVALRCAGKVVGSTKIELRWPDTLGFTNSSVSLDFGETSDLTFKPTWQGREVVCKDGDLVWSFDESRLTYKHTVDTGEQYYTPYWQAAAYRWSKLSLPLTEQYEVGDTISVEYKYDAKTLYESLYTLSEKTLAATDDGTVQMTEKLTHQKSIIYKYNTYDESKSKQENILQDNITEDKEPAAYTSDNSTHGVRGIQSEKTFRFSLGRFADNRFTADAETSLRGTACAALSSDASVRGAVDIVVGMEPFVLMDFEDHVENGVTTGAAEYWKCHVGASGNANNKSGQLTSEEVRTSRLWIRDTTGKGTIFPVGYNRVVSADEDENVRFGHYAFKLGYDFTAIAESTVAAADFGFSGDMLVNTVQPTKIGMWINVPDTCKNDNSILKAVLKGGAVEGALATSYMTLQADGSMTYKDGYQLTGTTSYVQYYSYKSDGTVDGSMLSDWAGKGWLWVEADISAFQMPLDVCRGYTVRVTSPQNCTKSKGCLYIDNLQFIYGTNTNDVHNPVIESVTETGSNMQLSASETTMLGNGTLNFNVTFSDSELTDKYATGINTGLTRVYVDGVDYTDLTYQDADGGSHEYVEITAGSLYMKNVKLRNGVHTLTVYLKDNYGLDTTATYYFKVDDPVGTEAGIALVPQEGAPEIGKDYAIYIVNITGETVAAAELEIELPESYLALVDEITVEGYGYTAACSVANRRLKVTLSLPAIAPMSLDPIPQYTSEMACLVLKVPATEKELRFTLKKGSYTTVDPETGDEKANTFVGTEQTVASEARYTMHVGNAIAGLPTQIKVTDEDGRAVSRAKIYMDGVTEPIGTTGLSGVLSYTFNTAGACTLHAEKDGGISWSTAVTVCRQTAVNSGKPFGILTNAAAQPQTTQSLTWLAQIGGTDKKAVVEYSTNADLSGAQKAEGTSDYLCFTGGDTGNAVLRNTVRLTGLRAGTTYYYRVGDGKIWSETGMFTTDTPEGEKTRFFVLGDIQTSDTSNLAAVLRRLSEESEGYDFAVQTGDAIDNVTQYGNWEKFLTEVNGGKLGGVDLVHALGNHEYYGDPEGAISAALYDLPTGLSNDWYVFEYGKVCVVVINHQNSKDNGDLVSATQELAEQLETDCPWKILVTHEPIYGTTDVMAADKLTAIAANLERAGIDFVFSGDDHALARTYPMIGNVKQAEDSRAGVVYYISGDLSSKSNDFTKQDAHAFAAKHNDYIGAYLGAEATDEKIVITAYDKDGNVLDTYTEECTECELSKHTVNAESRYDLAAGKVSCSVCGKFVPFSEVTEKYSGLLDTTDGGLVLVANNVLKTSGFAMQGELMYHSHTDGRTHLAPASGGPTCTKAGRYTYTCSGCSTTSTSSYIYPKGHTWNDAHVCIVCNTAGVDINDKTKVTFTYAGSGDKEYAEGTTLYYNYNPSGTNPRVYVRYGDYELTSSNDATLDVDTIRDLYVQWPDNRKIGKAEAVYTGRADFYGEHKLTYTIVPRTVSGLAVSDVGTNGATLSWTGLAEAQWYQIYRCETNSASAKRTLVAKVESGTSYVLTDLAQDAETYYVVYAFANGADGKEYFSLNPSNIVTVRTNPDAADVTGVYATVDGMKLEPVMVGEDAYLFLPASAKLSGLNLTFTAGSGTMAVRGDKGTQYVRAGSNTLDLTKLVRSTSGVMTLTASIGEGGKSLTFRVMQGGGLSTIYLTSADAANAGRPFVDAKKGQKASVAMTMVSKSGSVVCTSDTTEIKARGNSTFYYAEKKSYQIKLNSKADLLGTGEKVKTWVLLANYFDATAMHDKLFKDLAAAMSMPYTASSDWVDLYYDGEYRGTYLLSEKVSVNSTGVDITDMEEAYEAVNPGYGSGHTIMTGQNSYGQTIKYTARLTEPDSITGGYLIELNNNEIDEYSGFTTKKGISVNVKSPEFAGKAAMTYISDYYQAFEDAVFAADHTGYNAETGKYYYEYVDLDSLVKMFLLDEFGVSPDGFLKSFYFYKDVDGTMYAGPVWDMDMTLGTAWNVAHKADVEYRRHYLGEALYEIPGFRAAVEACYKETFAPLLDSFFAANGKVAQYETALKNSAEMNCVLWPLMRLGDKTQADAYWPGGTEYADVVEGMKTWAATKITALNARYHLTKTTGDVNMDGRIDTIDAVAILRYLVGYEDDIDVQSADVNNDGVVNTADAVALLRRLVGLTD